MLAKVLQATAVMALLVAEPGHAADQPYSQPARNDIPRQVFWGDTHLHTRMSADAYSLGNTAITPDEAYRFARGEMMTAQNGEKLKLRRPLDFLVVSDHAEYLGMFAGAQDGAPVVTGSSLGATIKEWLRLGQIEKAMSKFLAAVWGQSKDDTAPEVRRSIWQDVGEQADRYNDPGHFTAFIGYEYTSMPIPNNLHRVVVFRDSADKTSKILPFSAIDSINPEDLWAFLADYETKTGGSVLAIPHNSNLSGGLMFDETQYNGDPITAQYARTRIRWEPIHEVTQIKGDSETHPFLSPDDEFADYETWNSWGGGSKLYHTMTKDNWSKTKPGEYARSALRRGLAIEQKVGINPYKFGMIGSTDSHTSFATADEDNFFGKFPNGSPAAKRWMTAMSEMNAEATSGLVVPESGFLADTKGQSTSEIPGLNWTTGASGLAAVWANENTRAGLFDAMRRKEVYATTGPRMVVRFFGGWDYPVDADKHPDYVDIGYNGGVPMGGDIAAAAPGRVPRFIVLGAKDPDGANLDRIQIIKGWIDTSGQTHEKVYDVIWSGDRKRDSGTGRLEPVGSTVVIAKAEYTNTIGSAVLSTTWTDPDFDPKQRAFYYARVIEIPTPRWTAYDMVFFKIKIPNFVPVTTQERAYTSPIWYTPQTAYRTNGELEL